MNVASLELSKQLHALSGWEDVRDWWWGYHAKGGDIRYEVMQNAPRENCGRDDAPAYDIGYLLRKLPQHILGDDGNVYRFELNPQGFTMSPLLYKWCAAYGSQADHFGGLHLAIDETPEDAVAKLVIELFKQGVLARGGDE